MGVGLLWRGSHCLAQQAQLAPIKVGQRVALVGSRLQVLKCLARGDAVGRLAPCRIFGVLQGEHRQVVLGLCNASLGGARIALRRPRQIARGAQPLRMQQTQVEGGAGVTLVRSVFVDLQLACVVGRGLQALRLKQAQLVEGGWVVLVCRLLQPAQGGHFVGWHFATSVQQHACSVLRHRVALFCGLHIKRQRGVPVLCYAHAQCVQHAQIVLGPGVAQFGAGLVELQRAAWRVSG